MSGFIEPTPLNDIACGTLTDLGGTKDSEALQQSVADDCRVNGVEFTAKEQAPAAAAPQAPKNDFSNLIGGPKAPGLS